MKKIYTWHRRLSLIIALPVVLSAGSGILHPIMTNIRPAVATQGLAPMVIDSSSLRVSAAAALDSNHIDSVSRVRLVHIDSNWFYQIQRWGDDVPVYLSAKNGHKLYQGDWLYAQWLARQFLEGGRAATGAMTMGSMVTASAGRGALGAAGSGNDEPDCCNAATSSVLNSGGAKILGAVRLTDFDMEYNEVNRLAPVYRIAFDRPDGIRIYVETTQDRFALAVDNRRAAFNRVFEYIHTYEWLSFLGKGRPIAEFLLIGLAFVTTLLGVCIFFSTSSKRVRGNAYVRARRNHRYTAIVVSIFTLAFTFSGAFHALTKLKDVPREQYVTRFASAGLLTPAGLLAPAGLGRDFLTAVAGRAISGLSAVTVDGDLYWRVRLMDKTGAPYGAGKTDAAARPKDLMRDMQANAPSMVYVRVSDGKLLADGEQRYARWLATQFSGHPESEVVATTLVTKFDRDYNFTAKRLPVWRVAYPGNHHERYYVETCSGALAVRVDDLDVIESYSFALLHKHEFLGGLGKSVKDFSTMFWAAAQLLLVTLGLVLYVRQRRRAARPF